MVSEKRHETQFQIAAFWKSRKDSFEKAYESNV